MHLSSLILCCLPLSDLLTTFSLVLKNLPPEVRQAQEEKLSALKKQQEIHTRLAAERKIFLRGRKIKFFGESSSLSYLMIIFLLCPIYLGLGYNLRAALLMLFLTFHCLERRKVERRIRRLEKLQRTSSAQAESAEIAEQLSKLKEDLKYVMVCVNLSFNGYLSHIVYYNMLGLESTACFTYLYTP